MVLLAWAYCISISLKGSSLSLLTKAFYFILHTHTFIKLFLTLSFCRALVETCCYGTHPDLSNAWDRSCQAKCVHVKPHITAMQPTARTWMEPSIHTCAHTQTPNKPLYKERRTSFSPTKWHDLSTISPAKQSTCDGAKSRRKTGESLDHVSSQIIITSTLTIIITFMQYYYFIIFRVIFCNALTNKLCQK